MSLTRDSLPHFHELEHGLIMDIGYTGSGVGLQTAVGKALAAYCLSGNRENLPFMISPIKPLPFHGLNELHVSTIIAWYRLTE